MPLPPLVERLQLKAPLLFEDAVHRRVPRLGILRTERADREVLLEAQARVLARPARSSSRSGGAPSGSRATRAVLRADSSGPSATWCTDGTPCALARPSESSSSTEPSPRPFAPGRTQPRAKYVPAWSWPPPAATIRPSSSRATNRARGRLRPHVDDVLLAQPRAEPEPPPRPRRRARRPRPPPPAGSAASPQGASSSRTSARDTSVGDSRVGV